MTIERLSIVQFSTEIQYEWLYQVVNLYILEMVHNCE